jgi:hypothetical protein
MSSFDCRIYITFHKILPIKSYENLDKKWLEKYCRFVAANIDIEKIIPEELAPFVIWEKDFPVFNPNLQRSPLGYRENSVLFHCGANYDLYVKPFRYVGFLQYDMILTNDIFEDLDARLSRNELFFLFTHKESCVVPFAKHLEEHSWRNVLNAYNECYKTNYVFEDICTNDIILWNSWIIPKEYFKELLDVSFVFCLPLEKQLIPLYSENFNNLAYVFEIFHGFLFMIMTSKYGIKWDKFKVDHVVMLAKDAV